MESNVSAINENGTATIDNDHKVGDDGKRPLGIKITTDQILSKQDEQDAYTNHMKDNIEII